MLKVKSKSFYLLTPLLVLYQLLAAQDIPNRFMNVSVGQGLSAGTINAILQDKTGFLWFGTEDGLNRFDGYRFIVHKSSFRDTNSLSNNYIWSLAEDDSGKIWIGTDGGGLNRYDPVSNKFKRYYSDQIKKSMLPALVVQSLLVDSNNNLWIGTWGDGLYFYSPDSEKFSKFNFTGFSEFKEDVEFIWTIYEDSDNNLWIGTDLSGLIRFNPQKNEIRSYKSEAKKNSLSSNSVVSICEDNLGNLWLGNYLGGINKLEPENGKITNVDNYDPWRKTFSESSVMRVICDGKGRIWAAGMEKGLFLYNTKQNEFINYKSSPFDAYSISTDNLRSLFIDKSNNLWIGTLGEGLNKINIGNNNFYFIKNRFDKPNSLRENFTFAILEDSYGDIWFGSYGGGISKKTNNGDFIFYTHSKSSASSLNSDLVRAIFEDSNENVWIGTYPGGLAKYIRESESFKRYDITSGDLNGDYSMIRVIFEDSEGYLWIGTKGEGLIKFDSKKGILRRYLSSENKNSISGNEILSICEDSSGNLWIGTFSDGLNKFNKSDERFVVFKNDIENDSSISNNIVTELHYSREGILYAGTWGGGLNIYDNISNSFSSISTETGLQSDVICSIIEDKNGNLWISTLRGISKLNTSSSEIKNYNESDGLLPGEFNPGAAEQTKDGWIYFGGTKGINYFHPDSIYDSNFNPPVVITSFKKFNNEIRLEKSIEFIDTLSLSYSDDNFSFEFSSLDYSNPEKIEYSYKLENFDKDWIYSGNRRFANYTHLDHGKYLFKVRGTNRHGQWSNRSAQVFITISPPFWSTWYFRAALFLVIGFFGYSIFRKKKKQLENERIVQENYTRRLLESQEMERKRIASGLHDGLGQNLLIMKNRSLLGLNSNDLDVAKKELEEISSTASSAIDEVRQISYNLHPYQLSRLGLTKAIESMINNTSSSSEIKFSKSIENIDDLVSKQSEINIYRIVQECINNIIKHSKADNVKIKIKSDEKKIDILVIDDGIGFDAEVAQAHGFGMQNLLKRTDLLKGKLNIDSSSGRGTKINIVIPK